MLQHTINSDAPFGLLGRRLAHSWSPRIHASLGSVPYALIEKEPDEVARFIRKGSWKGINVTIPYKSEAARLADEKSARVERLGVANTLIRRADGTIYAENTDVLGFAWMLNRFAQNHWEQAAHKALKGRKSLVLGSGGASQAVQAALHDAGAKTVVISRSGSETYATLQERHADAFLVVNTTPVGMYPHCPASPLSDEQLGSFGNLRGVLDVVYNPEHTGLCLAAKRLGIPHESGLAMLVAQAYHASMLFQYKKIDPKVVSEIEHDILRSTRNIALIGMPGCGKTSAGRRLARLTGRPFVDLDDCFVVDHGMTAAECITRYGEAEFRRLETQTAGSYASQSGLVIACGGGIVTQPHNFDILHQNSIVVFLDRDLDELSTEDRPLSQSKGVRRLAEERMSLYESWADLRIECTGSALGDAELIAKELDL